MIFYISAWFYLLKLVNNPDEQIKAGKLIFR